MTDCPCRGCEDRHFGCHAECERYKSWKTEYEETTRALHDEYAYNGNDRNRKRYWSWLKREQRR